MAEVDAGRRTFFLFCLLVRPPLLVLYILKLQAVFSTAPAPKSSSGAGKKALTVGAIVAICISAFALSKILLGTLCFLRWKKMHTECEVKLSGMYTFPLSFAPSNFVVSTDRKPSQFVVQGGK